jgi:Transposase DDE domain group 1
LTRSERRSLKARWRRERQRAVPSASSLLDWLQRFHDPATPTAVAGGAFILPVTQKLQGLWQVNQALLGFVQMHRPLTIATLDMDATLIETHKRDALPCYKGLKAYQPLNCWWAEQGTMLYSEFRDGNVPAGHEQLRVLQDALGYLPASVTKLSLRSDTAGYQEELLLYCGEGKNPRFGVIEFAIGADVTEAFRGRAGDPRNRMEAADPDIRRSAAADRPGMSGGLLRSQLGRTQPQACGLSLPGDPRAVAPTPAGR